MVAARIGEPITETTDVLLAESVILEASNQVRFYANQPDWTMTTANPLAVTIVVAAAARGFLNPSGYDMERGDMVTFNRDKKYVSGADLTAQEIAAVRMMGKRGNVGSIGMQNSQRPIPRSHSCPEDRGYAPFDWGGNKPFPLGYF
jgi:hypothetical protein